ncbi:ParM/StbA family protein [Sporosarcina sp. FA9]|uniref:ParM/StbA family protein n=1 Tax=Sporosarcina sp. FA9 TaxID=3413030 RepID=UPI003F65962A
MSKLLLGVDAGNFMAKTAGPYGVDSYRTAICDWFQRDFVESFGSDDMEFEVDGKKGYAGSIAEHEDVFGGTGMYGDTKAHADTKIRVLLALYRYINRYCPGLDTVSIVTGQPITSHNETEKRKLIDMLQGGHEFSVNNKKQYVYIEEIGIAAEGSGAFWSNPQMGKVRIIDVGSGTVNVATIIDKKIINNASETFNFGMETVNRGLDSVATGIIRATTKLRWERNDIVLVCGGVAKDILPYIQTHYPNAQIIQPLLHKINGIEIVGPVFANAIGNYELSKLNFG